MPYLLYYFCLVIKKNYLAKKWGGRGRLDPCPFIIILMDARTPANKQKINHQSVKQLANGDTIKP